MFDTAILTARQLQVDMTGIFERLATKCIDAAAYSRSFGLKCVAFFSFLGELPALQRNKPS
jgi:hypothetical protein